MKRWYGVGFATLALWATIGCSQGDKAAETTGSTPSNTTGPSADSKPVKVGIVFDSGGRGDKSFNDSAWAGVERAKKEFSVEDSPVESKSEKDYEGNLTALAEKGCDIVFAIGLNQKAALEKVAAQFPDIKFAIVDATPDPKAGLKNVRSLLFKEEEGSFLAGYLAGLMTKSNKIGFVGGMDIPLIHKFEAGYVAGAKTANPAVEFLAPKYTGNWDDVGTAKAAANILFGGGADVVYHAAGRAGQGVISAAKEQGKFAIGVDSDQDYLEPGTVLTSMVKHVDEAVYSTIKDVKDGKFTPDEHIYDLKVKGVGLSPMTYTKDKIGPDNMKKVDDISAKVVSGEIKVPNDQTSLDAYLATLKK